MKYYSEKLNRMFDSVKQLKAEEAAASVEQTIKEEPTIEDAKEQAPTKKQLAADVTAAEDALKKAYTEYDIAKKKANDLSEAYLKEISAILDPAKKAVKDAERAKYEAIDRFNKAYGPYQIVITGSRAAEEMLRALDELRNSRSFFNTWF